MVKLFVFNPYEGMGLKVSIATKRNNNPLLLHWKSIRNYSNASSKRKTALYCNKTQQSATTYYKRLIINIYSFIK
jgi:hypothetical protein